MCVLFMFVSLKSAPMASWKTAIILLSGQSLFSVPCLRVHIPPHTCVHACVHMIDSERTARACVCARACESVIVTWLIHHGQSPFDYKWRGPVINRWIQLPGRSCDTRSQSICTGTLPQPHCPAPAYPHTAHTLIYTC